MVKGAKPPAVPMRRPGRGAEVGSQKPSWWGKTKSLRTPKGKNISGKK